MALIETGLIWVTYAVALGILIIISTLFVFLYQKPGDRSAAVSIVSIITISSLLATILLLPVDVALVSSTVRSSEGARKDWATQNKVDSILYTLKVVYYTLYSLDAVLCLLVVPFTYFLYEEYDDREAEEGNQTLGMRVAGALKYTIIFVALVIVLFFVGFFIPVATHERKEDRDLDFFKHLLREDHGERALTFAIGLMMTIGTVIYALYTGAGMALLPVTWVKSAPSISVPTLAVTTTSELEHNRERQRQLEGRNEGSQGGLNSRDRRELEQLVREERTLVRRERLVNEANGEGQHILLRTWHKTQAVFRPLKLIGGLLLLVLALLIWVSMLLTCIDKIKNSVCKSHCGFLLGYANILNPVNWILLKASRVFPIDYILFLLLVVFFFGSSVIGIATVGIRVLWWKIFQIRKGRSSPQALLMATVLLTFIVLALNYSMAMIVAPQYSTFGPQTYCDRMPDHPNEQPDCSEHRSYIRHCTELAENHVAQDVCTPTVVSTFLNRISVNFAFFGLIIFWAQFAFLGIYMIVAITTLFRTPKLDTDEIDQDLEEDEEEGLLASTGRRFDATWQDITGRAAKNNPGTYGTSSGSRAG